MSSMTEKQNQQFEWVWRGLLVLALGVCGFFGRNIYLEQKEFNQQTNIRVTAIEMKIAETTGNRFTSTDWVHVKTVLDERDASMDKRITRVEDAIPAIRKSLERIEVKLEKGQPK